MQEIATALDEFHSAPALPDPDRAVRADEMSTLLDKVEKFSGLSRLKSLGAQYQHGDFFDRIRNAARSFLKECTANGGSWKSALAR